MLRFAVKRDGRAQYNARAKRSPNEVKSISADQSAYLICDSRSKGFPVQHVSKGFEAFFGCKAAECVGNSCSTLLGVGGLRDSSAALNKVAATAGIDVQSSVDRMSQAAEKVVQSAARGGSPPVLLVNANRSGDLCVCELSVSKNKHPTLGWSYHAAVLKDVSAAVSLNKLLTASAQSDEAYEQLCSEWRQATASRGVQPDLSTLNDELNGVAEAMWKDELAKGLKPKASQRSGDVDTSSIWSRSTASTLASRTSSKETPEKAAKAFHFGALLGSAVEHSECDDVARKRIAPETQGNRSVRRRECKEDKSEDSEGFQTASEDEREECERTSSNSRTSSLIADVVNPASHVDRPVLRMMKIPFVIACPTVPGFPICLRSKGFEDLFGPSMQVKLGCDAREVLRPSDPKETQACQNFFDAILQGTFYSNENADSMLDGWELPDSGRLPAGELVFMQTFRGRFGNPLECLVYLKHIELDDCPFLLALHSYVPSDAEDSSREKLLTRMNSRLDELIAEMASEYVYYAPMRRQTKYHP